jgi:hypothetical protein
VTHAGDIRALINGYRITQAIHVAAVLRISDLLLDGPRSAEELAASTEADATALRRVLRALAAEGVYVEDESGRFTNNDLSSQLCRDVAGSAGPFAEFVGQGYHWDTWGHLMDSVRSGKDAFADLYGTDVWTYRSTRPEISAVFDAFMATNTETVIDAVVSAYDFSGTQVVVDVGGGTGTLLGAVLEANPQASGVLFEQPVVIKLAIEDNAAAPWAARCQFVEGSMFESVPPGGDVYLLKSIVHDWPDADAVRILTRCREAMTDGSRLLILERILEGPNQGAATKFSDLNMLVMLSGRERSEREFADLCEQAGLRLSRTVATRSPWFILEVVPA